MSTIKTYCIECDREVNAPISVIDDYATVKNEEIYYQARVAQCPYCNSIIADSRLEGENLDAAYCLYCSTHGLMTKDEICTLRKRLGLSLREFSRFLGFGEQTATKYEKGSIPDLLHSNTMRIAESPVGAKMLLDLNRTTMSDESIKRVQDYIKQGALLTIECDVKAPAIRDNEDPTIRNGYRVYDDQRAAALVAYLASKCDNFYRTKMQKAVFFCDNLVFEKTGRSLTGTTYIHANHGPIMPGYDDKLFDMERRGLISQSELGWGIVIIPGMYASDIFSDEELELINLTAEFVNSFGSAAEISEYSHNLDAWRNTENGEVIEYGAKFGEIAEAIERRLAEQ